MQIVNTKMMMMHFRKHFPTRESFPNIIYPNFYFYRYIGSWSHHCGCEMSPAAGCSELTTRHLGE